MRRLVGFGLLALTLSFDPTADARTQELGSGERPLQSPTPPPPKNAHETEWGEHHFVLGLPVGLINAGASVALGVSLGYLYETERWGAGVTLAYLFAPAGEGALSQVNAHALYFFSTGVWSPYVGAGIAFMLTRAAPYCSVTPTTYPCGPGSNGAGGLAEVGFEFARFNRIHPQVAIQGVFPFFLTEVIENDPSSMHYEPAIMLNFSLTF